MSPYLNFTITTDIKAANEMVYKPLDICAACSHCDGKPCVMQSHCADIRRMTLEHAQQRISLRDIFKATPGYKMCLATVQNDICDMLAIPSGKLEDVLGHAAGGQNG